jgi:hypothetical protein
MVRAFAGPTFVIGGWQLMQLSNLAGLLIVYIGFLLCLAEAIWEPELLRRPYQIQIALIGAVVYLVVAFTIGVVSVAAPLEIYARGNSADYPNIPIGDIPWQSTYYPLRLMLANNSSHDYNDLDLIIKPDKPITKIAQITGFCRLHFEDAVPLTQEMVVRSAASGQVSALSTILIATDGGYRVRCNTMPAKSAIEIIVAVVTPDDKPLKKPTTWIEDVIRQPAMEDGVSLVNHWFTDSRNPNLATGEVFSPKPLPSFVWVYGTYKCLNRIKGKTEKILIYDLTKNMPKVGYP